MYELYLKSDNLRGNGMSPHLAQILDQALGNQEAVEIVYKPHAG